MDRIADRVWCRNEHLSEAELKRRLFERVARRMAELRQNEADVTEFCARLNPDVIVIASDQSLIFETQNGKATRWLRHRFGLSLHDVEARARVRVHPCQRNRIVSDLKAAGFEVVD